MSDHSVQQIGTDNYLVVEKLGIDWQWISKPHQFNTGKFKLKKLDGVEGKDQYQVEISDCLAALEYLDAE